VAAATPNGPDVRLASPVKRLIAYLIDGAIIAVVFLVLALVLGTLIGAAGQNGREFLASVGIVLYMLVFLVLWIGYFPWFWSHGGQTPGHKALGMRVVVEEDGSQLGFGGGLIRLFGYFVSGLVFWIGFIWILIDRRRRGWHDIMAGTIVVEA
jgi:uncharacterized RDD family membrane protein YckC